MSRAWWVNEEMHRLDGPAQESFYSDGQIQKQEWWVNDTRIRPDERVRAATNPATTPKRLARLARSVDPRIAAFAAHNPSCPPAAKVMWTLTQPS